MEILAKKPDLKYAFDIMDLYASDPEKRRELEERIRADKNYAYELAAKFEQGLEQGELKNKLETARKMREKRFSTQEISEITGLTMAQLKEHEIL